MTSKAKTTLNKLNRVRLITTVYRAPSRGNVSRILATSVSTGKRKTTTFIKGADTPENHLKAALALHDIDLGDCWRVAGVSSGSNGGHVFRVRVEAATQPEAPWEVRPIPRRLRTLSP